MDFYLFFLRKFDRTFNEFMLFWPPSVDLPTGHKCARSKVTASRCDNINGHIKPLLLVWLQMIFERSLQLWRRVLKPEEELQRWPTGGVLPWKAFLEVAYLHKTLKL